VNGTVNDLAMCGAVPRYLSLSFIIEEGLPMTEFWEILVGIREACNAAGVQVVTGDTKVVERGKGDKIFINTTGIGTIHPQAAIDVKRIEAGDQIIVSGPLAAHGMAIMSVREGLEFESTIESDTQPLNHLTNKLLDAFGQDIKLLRDPTRGGVATVLNEVARDCKLGVMLEQRAIPIDEQVAGACELLGLDPLYVANEGLFIAVVSAEVAQSAKDMMHNDPAGEGATIIGAFTAQHPRQVVMTSAIGGKRVVNMLIGEQLPRIC
jgi:hydrogenase expression/formation protein HypE